ncbi:undecaprenyl-phosphate glucose phosphotransferase [Zoogloea sp.]|uniref:undecaprenyl-phosphate glucose phosphotransferase n=1 Tax=Zoogloea sp. TaxID=49181 RepID=UPI002C4DD6CA|nr:undecaprenyl-phosphate glucose phosphotransferase [Zoogloea sp.]HQA09242.1 undecaprenyl-phosphate glucose phosphotransferase [Zoogloea sp.]HQE37693.1 undecaprenyl-phosphate glucose phosphotransferase [Zoogloea sp.]
MQAAIERQDPGIKPHLSLISFFEALVDPIAFAGSLLAVERAFGVATEPAYLALAIAAFMLAQPMPMHIDSGLKALYRGSWLKGTMVFSALTLIGMLTGYSRAYAPEVLLAWFLVGPPSAALMRHAAHALTPLVMAGAGYRQRAVIVGASHAGLAVADRLQRSRRAGKHLLGFFDDRHAGRHARADVPHLGPIRKLADFVRQQNVDVIYIALPMSSQPRILQLLDELRDTTVSIYFVPDFFMTDLIQARLDDLGGLPVVAVCESPFTGINGLFKQVSDFLMAALILVLISPLMIAIAIAIKLTSPGPVLFRQHRYGLDGERIVVYKFRSMSVCENGDTVIQARANDNRVTPLGAFLRRTSLDELPQFINVLQGRMSVVGPRPHAVAHNETYRKLIKGYMIRHKVRPGITGWAQVNGCRGETETLDKMKRRIDFDLEYLRRWSFLLDLRIILRTIGLMRRDPNAY